MKNTTLAIAVVAGLLVSTLATISVQASGYGYGYVWGGGRGYVPYDLYEVPTKDDTPQNENDTPQEIVERKTGRVLQIPTRTSTTTITTEVENNNEDIVIPEVLPQTGVELVYRIIKLINIPHTPSV